MYLKAFCELKKTQKLNKETKKKKKQKTPLSLTYVLIHILLFQVKEKIKFYKKSGSGRKV